jgi:DNA-binding MarR family transcriptional regulator
LPEGDPMYSGVYVTELLIRCHRFDKRVALSVGLSVEETHCLSQLYLHNPFCVRKLAELLGVSSTRISRILLALEKKGLIARRASPIDRRVELVTLTGKGKSVVTKLLAVSEESGREIFNGLPSGDVSVFRRIPEGEFAGE